MFGAFLLLLVLLLLVLPFILLDGLLYFPPFFPASTFASIVMRYLEYSSMGEKK
jgi:hypothetical protein